MMDGVNSHWRQGGGGRSEGKGLPPPHPDSWNQFSSPPGCTLYYDPPVSMPGASTPGNGNIIALHGAPS